MSRLGVKPRDSRIEGEPWGLVTHANVMRHGRPRSLSYFCVRHRRLVSHARTIPLQSLPCSCAEAPCLQSASSVYTRLYSNSAALEGAFTMLLRDLRPLPFELDDVCLV
jgi:hypothetical protein